MGLVLVCALSLTVFSSACGDDGGGGGTATDAGADADDSGGDVGDDAGPICAPGACPDNAVCDDATGEPVCTCREGYVGDDCAECDTAAGYAPHPITGDCTVPCPEGDDYVSCDGECVSITSRQHCGGCFNDCNAGNCSPNLTCQCFNATLTSCGSDECVDTDANSEHCGACGRACGDDELCVLGECVGSDPGCGRCPPNWLCCDGTCVAPYHLGISRQHCGACGNSCDDGQTCAAGTCRTGDSTECDLDCAAIGGICCSQDSDATCIEAFRLLSDVEHCGGCNIQCADGEVCDNGSCACPADDGDQRYQRCDGTCTWTDGDVENCGGCGEVCGAGELCIEGICVAETGDCRHEQGCYGNAACCDDGDGIFGVCVGSFNQQNEHCGGCGLACDGDEVCSDQSCQCPADVGNPNWAVCQGTCTDIARSTDHCGECDNACDDGEVCAGGDCVSGDAESCPASCDTVCCQEEGGSRCLELDELLYSGAHCGGCGITCDDGLFCELGQCVCPDGDFFTSCGADTCVNLRTRTEHCGACGNDCGEGFCVEGVCVEQDSGCTADCEEGQLCCGDTCGGPSRILFDANNCGGCGITCDAGDQCFFGSCFCPADRGDYGWTHCDGTCTHLFGSQEHCGACGNACGDQETCIGGRCVEGDSTSCDSCEDGTVCCQAEDGPESFCVYAGSDRNHCGACGNACSSGEYCANGQCTCSLDDPGIELCDGECSNVRTDRRNCGECGNDCGDGACVAGECVSATCSDDCGNDAICCEMGPTNVCVPFDELMYNNDHCGGCGVSCGGFESCDFGVCICPAEWGDERFDFCDDTCSDLLTDTENCGACANDCDPGDACVNGTCIGGDGECPGGCGQGQVCCDFDGNGVCLQSEDLLWSPEHCGACNADCGDGDCFFGECTCDPGPDGNRTMCDGECVDTAFNRDHCGGCGEPCTPGQACVAGDCVSGTGDCGASCGEDDICCGECIPAENLRYDTNNCGGCGIDCGFGWCDNGACRCEGDTELGPLVSCGSDCVILANSPQHCGECNNDCAAGEACIDGECTTGDGACTETCDPGSLCCDTDGDGMCFRTQDIYANQLHCGGCNNPCYDGFCNNGTCYCPSQDGDTRYDVCDGACTYIWGNASHCGGCGEPCAPGQGCLEGVCVDGDPGCGDCQDRELCCDLGSGAFCTIPRFDGTNCGGCGISCGNGWCQDFTCMCPADFGEPGYRYCNDVCIDTNYNPEHCGDCNDPCAEGERCDMGVCR